MSKMKSKRSRLSVPKCGVKSSTTKSKTITRLESLVSRTIRPNSLSLISSALDNKSMIPKSSSMLDLVTLEPSRLLLETLRTNLLEFVTLIYSLRVIMLLLAKIANASKFRTTKLVRKSNFPRAETAISLFRSVILSFA